MNLMTKYNNDFLRLALVLDLRLEFWDAQAEEKVKNRFELTLPSALKYVEKHKTNAKRFPKTLAICRKYIDMATGKEKII